MDDDADCRQLRLEIVRIRKAGTREGLAAIDDPEIVMLGSSAGGHALEYVGGDGRGVVIAGIDP